MKNNKRDMKKEKRIYMRDKEEERRAEYEKLLKEELIEKLLDMEEELIDANYNAMGEDL